jgi:hypothetical protein
LDDEKGRENFGWVVPFVVGEHQAFIMMHYKQLIFLLLLSIPSSWRIIMPTLLGASSLF